MCVISIRGLTPSAIQRKSQRIRVRGQPCGTYKYGRWLYTEQDIERIKIDYREKKSLRGKQER